MKCGSFRRQSFSSAPKPELGFPAVAGTTASQPCFHFRFDSIRASDVPPQCRKYHGRSFEAANVGGEYVRQDLEQQQLVMM